MLGPGEEDIVGREISVKDGKSLAVEVAQAQSHVMKDGVADLLWVNAILLFIAKGEVDVMTRMGAQCSPCWKKTPKNWTMLAVVYLTE